MGARSGHDNGGIESNLRFRHYCVGQLQNHNLFPMIEFEAIKSSRQLRESFSQLTEDDLDRFLTLGERRRVRPGETIIEEGDDYLAVNMLLSGTVRVETQKRETDTHPGTRVQLARLGPGAVFGEMAYLERSFASADVVAHDDVELLCIDGSDLDALIEADPGFGSRFYQSLAVTLANRVRATSRRVVLVERALSDRRSSVERRRSWPPK